jgi:hypothetical protein
MCRPGAVATSGHRAGPPTQRGQQTKNRRREAAARLTYAGHPDSEQTTAAGEVNVVSSAASDVTVPTGRGGDRRHQFPGRRHRINLRLNHTEHQQITAAAARCDLTPAGYCAEAALATASGTTPPGQPLPHPGISRAELAQLQRHLFDTRSELARVGNNLNQALTALHTTGRAPAALHQAADRCRQVIDQVETTITTIDRRLR